MSLVYLGYIDVLVILSNKDPNQINVEKLTWYQGHSKRRHDATKILLQWQLLEIRVSCLKTIEDKM